MKGVCFWTAEAPRRVWRRTHRLEGAPSTPLVIVQGVNLQLGHVQVVQNILNCVISPWADTSRPEAHQGKGPRSRDQGSHKATRLILATGYRLIQLSVRPNKVGSLIEDTILCIGNSVYIFYLCVYVYIYSVIVYKSDCFCYMCLCKNKKSTKKVQSVYIYRGNYIYIYIYIYTIYTYTKGILAEQK